MKSIIPLFAMLLMTATGCTGQNYYEIETSYGRMVLRLYDETPLHRDNFAKLVDEGFYDNTTFHRVIANFMIQGGDPNSKDDDPSNDGIGGPGYTIPGEFNPNLLHKKGALSAARQSDQTNPERESSGSQFYIVQGRPVPPEQLAQVEQGIKRKFGADFSYSEEARRIYATEGGTPFLDMDYTVFGELVEGIDVLDRIANADTQRKLGQPQSQTFDRPLTDITMTIRKLSDYTPE
ncbi:MAG: peptidylprolyl isomerase [Rhodothermia bacterium]|nr:MAG: peptidylprolyl isomerase [Rhodothermia bacterium]